MNIGHQKLRGIAPKPIETYIQEVAVATCENCRTRRTSQNSEEIPKRHLLKVYRVKLSQHLNTCPLCKHALYWERVPPTAVNEIRN